MRMILSLARLLFWLQTREINKGLPQSTKKRGEKKKGDLGHSKAEEKNRGRLLCLLKKKKKQCLPEAGVYNEI